jgi:hypothetical protein
MTTTTDDPRLRHALDRLEIQELVARYALGQDLHQDGDDDVLREWRDVFTADAVLDYSAAGVPAPLNPTQVAELMRGPGGSMSALTRWQHLQGTAVITIDGDGDGATARTPHLHTHQGETDGRGWNLMQTGFFVDRLQHRPEGWRIVERKLEILWMDAFATIPNPLMG